MYSILCLIKRKALLVSLLIIGMLMVYMCGCGKKDITASYSVTPEYEFNTVILGCDYEDLCNAGFECGDSVDISFSNGFELNDIPYYSGYYVGYAEPLLCCYARGDKVRVTTNCKGILGYADFKEGDIATVSVSEKGKYLSIENTLSQEHSNNLEDYNSEEEFANFRDVACGNIKSGRLYRGASGVDDLYKRVNIVNKLLQKYKIEYVINLSENETRYQEMIEKYGSNNYYSKLFDEGNVYLAGLSVDFQDQTYMEAVADILRFITNTDGPVYMHCFEGKDRTGFVCMAIEGLCGASYDELVRDYMLTYADYYDINESTPEKYNEIKNIYLPSFFEFLSSSSDVNVQKNFDYSEGCREYFLNAGMTNEEIDAFIESVCN